MNTQIIILPPLKTNVNSLGLSSNLSSKLCHDLISPVSAINNAIELSEEEGFQEDIVELLKESAIKASHKLQFYRIAFGAYSNNNQCIDLGEAQKVAINYMSHEKAQLNWTNMPSSLSTPAIKLLLNLLAIANKSLPRGGNIDVSFGLGNQLDQPEAFLLNIAGEQMQLPAAFIELATDGVLAQGINPQNIQIYYSLLLAQEANIRITIKPREKHMFIEAAYI